MLGRCAALVLALCVPSTAQAIDRWVILSALEGELPAGLGAELAASARAAAEYRLGLEIAAPEALFVEGGSSAERALAACAADVRCLAATLAGTQATHALLWAVRRSAGTTWIALRLVDVRTAEVRHQAIRAAEGPEVEVAGALARELFDALGYAEGGRLVVVANPADAELRITDAVGERRSGSLLAPGRYSVELSREGYEAAARVVEVEARRETKVSLTLAEARPLLGSAWLWLGLGAAAVAAGVGIGVAASSVERCFCAAADPALCATCR